MPVGLADQLEAEIGEALLHPADQSVDLGGTAYPSHRIDISGVAGPVFGEPGSPHCGVGLVPQRNVALGDLLRVGHLSLHRWDLSIRLSR
jgi:hypothetical protein